MMLSLIKKIILLLVLTMSSCISRGQVQNGAFHAMLQKLLDHNVPEIAVRQAPIDSENVLYLDARDKAEYDVSHIENALRIGYDDFDMMRIKSLNKDRKVIVYCSVGYRSEKISQKLIKAGFRNVSNLYGGIFEWVNEERPVYNKAGEKTNDVHVYSKSWGIWLSGGNKIYAIRD